MRRFLSLIVVLLVNGLRLTPAPEAAALPAHAESVKFAVIGDTGTGDRPEYDVANQMAAARGAFPFDMVIMLGDNMYGRQSPQDFVQKFERPYAALLGPGVRFYAALGNHDKPTNVAYPGFNMGGARYYTYVKRNVRFVVLDSNQMDGPQLAWMENTLKESPEEWKICYFHHPIYSDGGRHGSDVELRVRIEPLLVRYGVNVVFAGHDHFYERTKPQKGITHFVNGSGGELARGDVHPSEITAAYFDQDQSFSLVEIFADDLFFEARSRTGRVVDSGVIHRERRGVVGVTS